MQTVTIVINTAPYGTEGPYNALRLAAFLMAGKGKANVRIFMVGDGVFSAKRGQNPPEGFYNIEKMLTGIVDKGAHLEMCGTCCQSRGIAQEDVIDGATVSSIRVLATWIVESDKVINF
jgi:uncharacterized protein involved in oxidation of intracellular sulfur